MVAGDVGDPPGLLPRGLVVPEDSVLDEQPLVGGNAFVVPSGGGETAFLSAGGLDVHQVLAAAERAEHRARRREETGPRAVRLAAPSPGALGRRSDGLVNPQRKT